MIRASSLVCKNNHNEKEEGYKKKIRPISVSLHKKRTIKLHKIIIKENNNHKKKNNHKRNEKIIKGKEIHNPLLFYPFLFINPSAIHRFI